MTGRPRLCLYELMGSRQAYSIPYGGEEAVHFLRLRLVNYIMVVWWGTRLLQKKKSRVSSDVPSRCLVGGLEAIVFGSITGVFGRFDLAALCNCRTLHVCYVMLLMRTFGNLYGWIFSL